MFRQFGDMGGLVGVVVALGHWKVINKVVRTNLLVHFGEFIVNPGHGLRGSSVTRSKRNRFRIVPSILISNRVIKVHTDSDNATKIIDLFHPVYHIVKVDTIKVFLPIDIA